MPRRKAIIRWVPKTIALPEDIVAKVELLLFSNLEGKVPFAAWKNYICALINADLDRRSQNVRKTLEP